jgi:hypothetical protein
MVAALAACEASRPIAVATPAAVTDDQIENCKTESDAEIEKAVSQTERKKQKNEEGVAGGHDC